MPIYDHMFEDIWWDLIISRRRAELIIYVCIYMGHKIYISYAYFI